MVLPMTRALAGALTQAVRIIRNNSSVPLSPTKNCPSGAFMNCVRSDFAVTIRSINAFDATLSRPWLSGIAANCAEVSITDFRVNAPPAFSKNIRSP